MLRSTREEGGPNRIELTVAERDGRLAIDQVTGSIEDAERRSLTVYERAVDEVDVGGTLFFDVKVAETQGEFPFVERQRRRALDAVVRGADTRRRYPPLSLPTPRQGAKGRPLEEVAMGFIGGGLRERFVDRVKDADPGKLLAVPIDVGKRSAAAMVCDFWGEIVIPPFDFPLNEDGFQDFSVALTRAEAQRDATWMRVGLESAGHYHRPLQARLEANGIEVTLFNPAQIKENRNQDLLRSLKSDAIDLAAMAELLIRGKGRVCVNAPDAVAIQGALALHRTRKIRSRSALKNQIHAHLDLVFPGLSSCLWNPIDSKAGRVLLDEGFTPERVKHLGPERLLRYCSHRGVRLTRSKAAQIVGAAQVAFALPAAISGVRLRILMADMELLAKLDQEVAETEDQLAEILPDTPADILTTLPRVSVVGPPTTAARLETSPGSATRVRSIGCRGWCRAATSRLARSGPRPRSRARGRSN